MNLHIIKKATFETTTHEDFTNYNQALYAYFIKNALDACKHKYNDSSA
jgi:hypothetical protein